MVPPGGIEPPRPGFSVQCSTIWATAAYLWFFALPQISMPRQIILSLIAIQRNWPQTLLLYVGCLLIPKNILGALFYFVAPVLKVTSEYSFLFGCSRGIRTPSLGYEPSELPLLYHCDIYGQFTRTMPRSLRKETMPLYVAWYLRLDSNQRSSGYEPDVLVN